MPHPTFPHFKPLELADREFIREALWAFQPETSELTFTNLFIWRQHYGLFWCLAGEHLLLVSRPAQGPPFALPPVGPGSRLHLARRLLAWLREELGQISPCLERADARLAQEAESAADLRIEPLRDHFDYLYATAELISLSGRKYHDKHNHLNAFRRNYPFTYETMEERHLAACEELADAWCRLKRCAEDLNRFSEWEAVKEALKHFGPLGLTGGVLLIEGRMAAFSLGELLNRETAVIHIEKADPAVRGSYAAINQQFLEHAWSGVPYVNREQDLGEPGLRTAKLSYHPVRLVEKFRIGLAAAP